jgi:hypothetical protein
MKRGEFTDAWRKERPVIEGSEMLNLIYLRTCYLKEVAQKTSILPSKVIEQIDNWYREETEYCISVYLVSKENFLPQSLKEKYD